MTRRRIPQTAATTYIHQLGPWRIVAGLYLLFAKRCEDYLSGALARLEKVNILGFCFSPKVAETICQNIVSSKTLKLRALKLWRPQDFPVSAELLGEVKGKIKLNFVNC